MRFHIWTIVIILLAFTTGCKDGPAVTSASPTATTPTSTPMGAPSGVEHYICPNGHVGSGGSGAGSCLNCGAVLEHNQAFHANDAPAPEAAPITTTTTPVNNTGVEHYICPNGHVGSGGAGEGTCSNCGAALEHNQAFHANDPAQNQTINPLNSEGAAIPSGGTNVQPVTPQPSGAVSPVFQNVGGGANFTNTAAPAPAAYEPPQNAAGIWHYTCSNGCAGGAGGASACSSCGSTLVHNQGYHN